MNLAVNSQVLIFMTIVLGFYSTELYKVVDTFRIKLNFS